MELSNWIRETVLEKQSDLADYVASMFYKAVFPLWKVEGGMRRLWLVESG